jgi:tetratricopeptide (TPR) repeat protein
MMPRPTAALLALCLLPACATSKLPAPPVPLSSQWSVPSILTDDDLAESLDEYWGMQESDAHRSALRDALLDAIAPRVQEALAVGAEDAAFASFEQALSLWTANELKAPITSTQLDAMAHAVLTAFAKQGQDARALTALAVLISLHPDDKGLASQFDEAASWADDAFSLEYGAGLHGSHLSLVAGDLSRDWPSPLVLAKATGWYSERESAIESAIGQRGFADELDALLGERGMIREAYGLARLYLRGGDLLQAAKQVNAIAGDSLADEPALRQALSTAAASTAQGSAYVELAKAFPQDPDVALAVCLLGTTRFPTDKAPAECAAVLALANGPDAGSTDGVDRSNAPNRRSLALAQRLLEHVVALDPSDSDQAQALGAIYGQRLIELSRTDDLGRIDDMLAVVLAWDQSLTQRFPSATPSPSPSDAYLLAGRGYLNAGEVARARTLFDRSIELAPTLDALEQRGDLEQRVGDPKEAIADFQQAAQLNEGKPEEQKIAAARLERKQGDAWAVAGDGQKSKAAYQAASTAWDQLLSSTLEPDLAAEGYVERGRVRYALGDQGGALADFDQALAAGPDNLQTYLDELSFLIPRGHLADALDVYHGLLRALDTYDATLRSKGIDCDYFRAYTSFWVLDLARIEGAAPDPLAEATLDGLAGSSWYDDLARYHLGDETEAEIDAKAVTPGERAELYFYQGMGGLADAKQAAANELWQKVVDTGMVSYLEFDMAQYFLSNGAPRTVGDKIARPSPDAAPDAKPVESKRI